MAAIFVKLDNNKSMFKGGFPASLVVRCPDLDDLFDEAAATSMLTIITDVSVENNDVIQFFITFDDVVRYFYFGKGVGSITLSGLIFTDCDGNMPGMTNLYDAIASVRGAQIRLFLGAIWFDAVITNHRVNLNSDPMLAEFQITMSIVDHSLPKPIVNQDCS